MKRPAALITLLWLASASACVTSNTVECANGVLCPSGSLCDEQRGRCITPAQIGACLDVAELAPCEYAGSDADARCLAGVCVAPACGDGAIDDGETCDDDNATAGDGCSATCQIEPEYSCESRPSDCRIPVQHTFAQGGIREVDLLFVVDNSGSMSAIQTEIQDLFPMAMLSLRGLVEGLPSLHIGVTSTDLGTGPHPIFACEDMGGDGGRLTTSACPGITGAPFIVDVEPRGCNVQHQEMGFCLTDCMTF